MGLTQCSIVQIIYRKLGLKCLSFSSTLLSIIVRFSCIYILQGIVAMQLRCGGILGNDFIANCIESVPVKEFCKYRKLKTHFKRIINNNCRHS